MQGSTVVRLLIVAAIAFVGYKWWMQKRGTSTPAPRPTTSPAVTCQFEARSAADFWSSNVSHYSNPPYDASAWQDFKSMIDDRMARADEKCSCSDDPCTRGREAMTELRMAVSDMDASVRSGGPPPSDLVQRAERIDQALK